MTEQRNIIAPANKSEAIYVPLLYRRFVESLSKKSDMTGRVPFPVFFEYCSQRGICKNDSWKIANELHNLGLARRVPYHGLQLSVARSVQQKVLEAVT